MVNAQPMLTSGGEPSIVETLRARAAAFKAAQEAKQAEFFERRPGSEAIIKAWYAEALT